MSAFHSNLRPNNRTSDTLRARASAVRCDGGAQCAAVSSLRQRDRTTLDDSQGDTHRQLDPTIPVLLQHDCASSLRLAHAAPLSYVSPAMCLEQDARLLGARATPG